MSSQGYKSLPESHHLVPDKKLDTVRMKACCNPGSNNFLRTKCLQRQNVQAWRHLLYLNWDGRVYEIQPKLQPLESHQIIDDYAENGQPGEV